MKQKKFNLIGFIFTFIFDDPTDFFSFKTKA